MGHHDQAREHALNAAARLAFLRPLPAPAGPSPAVEPAAD